MVTGGFGDLDQVKKAGLDTLVTGEADYPTEVKARELGINLILGGGQRGGDLRGGVENEGQDRRSRAGRVFGRKGDGESAGGDGGGPGDEPIGGVHGNAGG